MKFLLVAINAKFIHSNPAVYSLRAACAPEHREMVEIAEYTINQQAEDILGDIYERKPSAIGFSCYIWNWTMIRGLLGQLHKILPGVPFWLGGPQVSWHAEEMLERYPQVEGIMVGEGEDTFRELIEWYAKKDHTENIREKSIREKSIREKSIREKSIREKNIHKKSIHEKSIHEEDIRGLVIRDGQTALYTGERPPADVSRLPFLYEQPDRFANRIIYYESSRGCPYRCSYCLSSLEKQVRLRNLDIVKRELGVFLEHGVRQVKFIDRTFNASVEHSLEIWRFIRDHDNGVTNFHFEIGADILTEDQLQVLEGMRPGLVQLEIGVQSANALTLRTVRRNPDLTLLERNVERIGRMGNIHQHLDLIAGLPYEDYESFRLSFDRVYGMKPQQLQLGFLKVLRGSEIEKRAAEWGICRGEEPPYEVLFTEWLSYEEIRRLKGVEAMVEAYYNSGQFGVTLFFLEQVFPSAFDMFYELSVFYKEKGLTVASPSRVHRYEALLDFACKKDKSRERLYRESLTFDMYARENVKSRPAFAQEGNVDRGWLRELLAGEERERRLLPHYEGYDARQLARMTHAESFTYPVWEGREEEGCWYVLFDYKRISPIRERAAILVWRKEGTCITPISV